MYGADRQMPPAYLSGFPNGYESADIKILEWIRRESKQSESGDVATRCRKSAIAPGSSAKISQQTMFDLLSHERWGMEGIHYGI